VLGSETQLPRLEWWWHAIHLRGIRTLQEADAELGEPVFSAPAAWTGPQHIPPMQLDATLAKGRSLDLNLPLISVQTDCARRS
jgi:hypothetical protein